MKHRLPFVVLGLLAASCALEPSNDPTQRAAARQGAYNEAAGLAGDFVDRCRRAGGQISPPAGGGECCITRRGVTSCFSDLGPAAALAGWQRPLGGPEVVPTLDLSLGVELTIE